MRAKVALEITQGTSEGQRFEFDEHDTFVFGRSERNCHVCLPDDTYVSRHHFILEVNPPEARLRDLGSRNGTYVNGSRYGGRGRDESRKQAAKREYPQVDLKNGDLIKVGRTLMRVAIQSAHFPTTEDHERSPSPQKMPIAIEQANTCPICGRDVSTETPPGRIGDYICAACQEQTGADSVKFVNDWIKKIGAERVNDEPPAITGYNVTRKLGQGGMGIVYRAKRRRDKKTVAVKLMLSRIAVYPDARDSFLREAQVLRELRHPNIVRFLDVGAAESMFYFVMDFCEGGSLPDALKRRRNPFRQSQVGRMMLQSLKGLSYAHERGYVHRDLKPANILLHKTGRGWVTRIGDFGLAKNFQKAGFSGMTATGNFGGTYPFMPREQLTNFKYVQPASDIWSLGATFYYVLTRKYPRDFAPGQDPIDVVLEDNIVPIRKRDPNVGQKLAGVIDRAVASDVAGRFQSAAEMRVALIAALRSET